MINSPASLAGDHFLLRMADASAQQEIDKPPSKWFRRREIADLHFIPGQCGPVNSAVACRKTSNCSHCCDGRATGSAPGSLSEQYTESFRLGDPS